MRNRFKVMLANDRPVTVFKQDHLGEDDLESLILEVVRQTRRPIQPHQICRKVELTTDWDPFSISACIGQMVQQEALVVLQAGFIQLGS